MPIWRMFAWLYLTLLCECHVKWFMERWLDMHIGAKLLSAFALLVVPMKYMFLMDRQPERIRKIKLS